jgi:hypothetical protein
VYVSLAAMLVGAALSGLGVVALGPLAIALCTFIQAPLSTAVATPPRCASCGVYVEPEAPAEARRAPRGAYPVRA